MEQLNISINYENNYGVSYYNNAAPHIFILKFWRVQLGSKNRSELAQFWILNFNYYLATFGNLGKSCKMQNWNFLNNLEVHVVVTMLSIAFGLEVWKGFAPLFVVLQLLLYST